MSSIPRAPGNCATGCARRALCGEQLSEEEVEVAPDAVRRHRLLREVRVVRALPRPDEALQRVAHARRTRVDAHSHSPHPSPHLPPPHRHTKPPSIPHYNLHQPHRYPLAPTPPLSSGAHGVGQGDAATSSLYQLLACDAGSGDACEQEGEMRIGERGACVHTRATMSARRRACVCLRCVCVSLRAGRVPRDFAHARRVRCVFSARGAYVCRRGAHVCTRQTFSARVAHVCRLHERHEVGLE
eukprot:6197827-Pleurochrysis_carterae.AAC.2